MKIKNLPKQTDGFQLIPSLFCGKDAVLVVPQKSKEDLNIKWDKQNLIFRSSIWSYPELKLLSGGYKKFYNYGEKPDLYPDPEKHKDSIIEEKEDGSLCIVDFYNNQLNIRTRGTFSYKTLKNAEEFELLLVKHPKVKEFLSNNAHLTLLMEILSPTNVIVIKPEKVKFVLLDVVEKMNYLYLSKNRVKEIAEIIGDGLETPELYNFNSLTDIFNTVKEWRGNEGVVLSYNNNQNKIKLKSDWYRHCHAIKSFLNSENNLIELYVNLGMPDYQTFFNYIAETFDFELAEFYIGDISRLVEASKKVNKIIDGMKDFVYSIREFKTRKDQALHIIQSYGETARKGMVFKILDNQELNSEDYKKLIWQSLKG
jgi:cell fate (sporulation/competence/biofilm development) regulator YlbF (YheA/YmcA/DUF963 family)